MLNPRVVEGQLHGATAQGLGRRPLRGDRLRRGRPEPERDVPGLRPADRARLPTFEVEHLERPDPNTPLGMKGMAEGGTMGASAAISNAVADALAPLGLDAGRQPFTARRIAEALRRARQA